MPAASQLRQALEGTLRDVEAISGLTSGRRKVSRELVSDLRLAERRLAAVLRREARIFGAIDERFTGAQAVVFSRRAQLQIEYLQLRLAGVTQQQARIAMSRSIQRTAQIMERLEHRFTGIFTRSPLRAASQFDRAMAKASASILRTMPTSVQRYGLGLISRMEDTLRIGLLSGMTTDQMIGAITGFSGPKGTVAVQSKVIKGRIINTQVVDVPEGLFQRHRYWAERIVRTETMRAYNEARGGALEVTRETTPDVKKKILAVFDNRTAPDSIVVNGQVRELEGLFVDGAGRRYKYPPARPNDRETVIPWREAWSEPARQIKSQTDRALLGELTRAEEDALIAKVQKRQSAPPKARKKAKPARPTRKETLLKDYTAELGWVGDTLHSSGTRRGVVLRQGAGWWARYRSAGGGEISLSPTPIATKAEARKMLEARVKVDLENAADLTAPRFSHPRLEKALLAADETEVRHQVRAMLRGAGVLPRDPARNLTTANVAASSKMPRGAEAFHRWDGAIGVKRGALKRYGKKLANGDTFGLDVLVHEEMHGATPFATSAFYRGAGATIEEVTVEMASRRIVAKRFKKQIASHGAYQRSINEVSKVLDDVLKSKQSSSELIARAGIKMRAPGAITKGISSTDGIIEAFVDALGVRDQGKRSSLLIRLRGLRGPR